MLNMETKSASNECSKLTSIGDEGFPSLLGSLLGAGPVLFCPSHGSCLALTYTVHLSLLVYERFD